MMTAYAVTKDSKILREDERPDFHRFGYSGEDSSRMIYSSRDHADKMARKIPGAEVVECEIIMTPKNRLPREEGPMIWK